MAKRFGRNQRRQMREEIEHLRKGIDMAHGIASFQRNRADRREAELNRWAEDIWHLCRDNSAFLREWSSMTRPRTGMVQFAKPMNISQLAFAAEMLPIDMATSILRAFVYTLEVDRDAIAPRIIVRLEGQNADVAYALDERMIHDLPPRMVDQVGRDIAKQLASYLSKPARQAYAEAPEAGPDPS